MERGKAGGVDGQAMKGYRHSCKGGKAGRMDGGSSSLEDVDPKDPRHCG